MTPVRLGDIEREHLAALLGRHYAEGRLGTDELDDRLDRVNAAQDDTEAVAAVADLPSLTQPAPARARRARRHGGADGAQPGWLPTPERFADPTTDRVMRVWIDPRDRRRHYVADG